MLEILTERDRFQGMFKETRFNRVTHILSTIEVKIRHSACYACKQGGSSVHTSELAKPHVERHSCLMTLLYFLIFSHAISNATK